LSAAGGFGSARAKNIRVKVERLCQHDRMTDNDIIAEAYAERVRNAWNVFYGVMISKPTDAEIKRSEQAFACGVATAHQVRDRAIELLKASS
jgi:hypothetical protein